MVYNSYIKSRHTEENEMKYNVIINCNSDEPRNIGQVKSIKAGVEMIEQSMGRNVEKVVKKQSYREIDNQHSIEVA